MATTIALGTLFPSMSAVLAQDEGFSVSDIQELSGVTAIVSGSDNGLRLRSDAAYDSEIIETLIDGTVVTLRIDAVDTVLEPDGSTRWWPVTANGNDGWVSGFYLSATDEAVTETAATSDMEVEADSEASVDTSTAATNAFTFDGESLVGATALVHGAGGSVNLRTAPSSSSELVTTLSDGAVVDRRVDSLDTVVEGDIRWWPISIGGFDGWISGEFLVANNGDTPDTTPDEESASSDGSFSAGSFVVTYTGDGEGVFLRAGAELAGEFLLLLSEGSVVQIMEGPVSFTDSEAGWFKVTTGDVTGFVDGDLLRDADQPVSEPDTATEVAFFAGDFASVETATVAGARIRAGASPESDRIGFVPETGLVEILSGPASYDSSDRGWYEVRFDGVTGFVDGDLLVRAAPPVVKEPVAETPVVETPAPALAPAGTFSAGDAVVTDSQTGVGVNVRVMPGIESERVGFLADLSSLSIVEGPSQDTELASWYKVTNGDLEGWVAGEFLQRAKDAAVFEEPAAAVPVVEEAAPRFIVPLEGYRVSQNFGCSNLSFYTFNEAFGCNIHDGIDLAAPSGTTLRASADGTVVFSGWCDCGLGFYVEIDHGNGINTVYGHMESQPPVSVGQVVSQGEAIGPLGSTGLSTGPHVHFMFRVDGNVVNPRDYIDFP
ncbi:MAG: SH3 domain-containing protein [Thermomicrobiales bacterium]